VTSTTGDVVIQTEKDGEYYVEVSMPAQAWLYAPDFNVVAINKQRAQAFMRPDYFLYGASTTLS
jgi:hypothetical protein